MVSGPDAWKMIPPNSALNVVIVLQWLSFGIALLGVFLGAAWVFGGFAGGAGLFDEFFYLIGMILLGLGLVTALIAFYFARGLRRYNNTAKTILLVLTSLGLLSNLYSLLTFGSLPWLSLLIGGYTVYVLAFHEETKLQFARYNGSI
jgi:hypothetical protein